MRTFNHIDFTEKQQQNLDELTRVWFSNKKTDDYFHFSFNGTKMNFDTNNIQAVYEIHTEESGYFLTIELNENKKGLSRTIKLNEIK